MTPKQLLSRALTDTILRELRESGRYHLPGFGVWTLKTRPRRRIRNPATKELMWLPASREVRFHAAKRLKKAAQGPQQPRLRKNGTRGGSDDLHGA